MHPSLTDASVVLRRGSYRLLGPMFLAIGVFSGTMMYLKDGPVLGWVVPPIFLWAGLHFLISDSRYILFRNGAMLHWSDHSGRNRNRGRVDLEKVAALEVYRIRAKGRKVADELQLELVAGDGRRTVLPRNLGFGGPGNPRYDDFVEDLHRVNPGIEVRVLDHQGWRHKVADTNELI
jgi:hypothetical protein